MIVNFHFLSLYFCRRRVLTPMRPLFVKDHPQCWEHSTERTELEEDDDEHCYSSLILYHLFLICWNRLMYYYYFSLSNCHLYFLKLQNFALHKVIHFYITRNTSQFYMLMLQCIAFTCWMLFIAIEITHMCGSIWSDTLIVWCTYLRKMIGKVFSSRIRYDRCRRVQWECSLWCVGMTCPRCTRNRSRGC